jgi:hypothetical protein
MGSLSPTLRIGAAIALLLLGLVDLLRFLALTVSPSLYPLATYGALALLAALSGVGLWLRTAWAPAALLALGCVFAATRLIDPFVLGLRPWLFALLAAVAALVAALLLAAWARAEVRPLT